MNPTIDQFQLVKVKLQKNNGVLIQWEQTADGATTSHGQTSPDWPHFNFYAALKAFKTPLQIVVGLTNPSRLSVTGITLKGETLLISGSIETEAEIPLAIHTHRIKISDGIYGFESGLEYDLKTLTSEAYAYLFQNKRAEIEPLEYETT